MAMAMVVGRSGQFYSPRDNSGLKVVWDALDRSAQAEFTFILRRMLAEQGVPPVIVNSCKGVKCWGLAVVLDGCPVQTLPDEVLGYIRLLSRYVG